MFKIFFAISLATSTSLFAERIDVIGKIRKDQDISAISCFKNNICFVASDETNSVQKGRLNLEKMSLEFDKKSKSVKSLGEFDSENDLEGMTNHKRNFFVVGSHGLSRKKGEYNKSRFKVFKFRLKMGNKFKLMSSASLEETLAQNSVLKNFLKKPLMENGIDIEGLAYHKGRLYFGLRNPVIDGHALVFSLKERALFSQSQKNLDLKIMKIKTAPGKGIRSLEFYGDKLYFLSGNDDISQDENNAQLGIFDLKRKKVIQRIEIPNSEMKAEGFHIVAPGKVIIVYDSEENGKPTLFSF